MVNNSDTFFDIITIGINLIGSDNTDYGYGEVVVTNDGKNVIFTGHTYGYFFSPLNSFYSFSDVI